MLYEVITKSDIHPAPEGVLGVSGKTGAGISRLVEEIAQRLEQRISGAAVINSVITSYSIHYTKLYDIHRKIFIFFCFNDFRYQFFFCKR